jgi:pilus assembly protein CpaF
MGGDSSVRRLAVNLLAEGGRALDDAHPAGDARLPGDIRVHAVLPPLSRDGVALSIRVPRPEPLSLEDWGLSGDVAARLRGAVLGRRNLLIAGGTGTGKTTLVASLLREVPASERIVLIEDVAELSIDHPHVVHLESRSANPEGLGAWTLSDLLRESLRMRPDRLVVGECRGAELSVMLTALNTGHDGSATTLHAGTLAGVPARLEALGALSGLSPEALAGQAVAAIHLVVFLRRDASGRRRVEALGELVNGPAGIAIRATWAETQ